MCGRFTLRTPAHVIAEFFQLLGDLDWDARYNIAPTQQVLVVRERSGQRLADRMQWGLVPSWSKDPKIASRLINARAETLAEKPAFRSAFRHRRCLIVADGFYEWKREGQAKQPIHIHHPDHGLFAFAGLWEHWSTLSDGVLESCTIITTESNELLRTIHDRMPVILSPSDYSTWLDAKIDDPKTLYPLLLPCRSDLLTMTPVNAAVNNVRNDSSDLLAPL